MHALHLYRWCRLSLDDAGRTGHAGSTRWHGHHLRWQQGFCGGHKISIVDIATGTVSALAGTGQAGYKDNTVGTRAEFSSPTDVKLTPDGLKVLVTDLYNNKIRSVDLATRQRFSNSIHLPFGAIWYRLCRVADFSEFLQ